MVSSRQHLGHGQYDKLIIKVQHAVSLTDLVASYQIHARVRCCEPSWKIPFQMLVKWISHPEQVGDIAFFRQPQHCIILACDLELQLGFIIHCSSSHHAGTMLQYGIWERRLRLSYEFYILLGSSLLAHAILPNQGVYSGVTSHKLYPLLGSCLLADTILTNQEVSSGVSSYEFYLWMDSNVFL